MNYYEFQKIVSAERLQRYLEACNGDKERTLALYRTNVRLSLEMFAVVGAFEIALRNSIDKVMTPKYGSHWLRDAVKRGGFLDVPQCRDHAQIIRFAYEKLLRDKVYTHGNLLAKMEFGIWKYMFSSPQYRASGRVLLQAFPNKPTSNRKVQYNNVTIFNELDHVNSLRNRIAHHVPICFQSGYSIVKADYVEWIYNKILTLFNWMGINPKEYLADLSQIEAEIRKFKQL